LIKNKFLNNTYPIGIDTNVNPLEEAL